MRDIAAIETWLAKGIQRAILGTAALRNPDLVREACRQFPKRIAVGIDARDGFVAIEGWSTTSSVRAIELGLRLEDAGVAAIIYTDINRDGAMTGVNVESTVELAWALTTPVIASGGVASLDDLRALKAESEAGIEGVICGRALYDGRIDAGAAVKLLKS
jgi:phosphoribosylformimino-5-aminoimidazole carboxamide ribotide isomerase